jgi:hypothetical protein
VANVYAPIDLEVGDLRGGMEGILQSLGAVLDTHLARDVRIRQRPGGLAIRALAVAGIAQRLDGAWSRVEQVVSHVDLAQTQVAAAARQRAGHVAGPHEHSLRVLGRVIDRRHLRDVALIQHPSDAAWLLWHRASEQASLTLITLTNDELAAADTAAGPSREQLAAAVPEVSLERLRGQWNRRTDGRMLRPGSGPREAFRIRPGMGMLAHAGAMADR